MKSEKIPDCVVNCLSGRRRMLGALAVIATVLLLGTSCSKPSPEAPRGPAEAVIEIPDSTGGVEAGRGVEASVRDGADPVCDPKAPGACTGFPSTRCLDPWDSGQGYCVPVHVRLGQACDVAAREGQCGGDPGLRCGAGEARCELVHPAEGKRCDLVQARVLCDGDEQLACRTPLGTSRGVCVFKAGP